MKNLLPVLIPIPLLVAFGVAEGLWTNRWQLSDQTERAAARLAAVPLAVGDWQGQDQQLDPRQVAQAEMAGYLMRRYVHPPSGAELTVLLVCGRPGPTSLHTPDVCYAGNGYTPTDTPARHEVQGDGLPAPAGFWVGQFRKPGPVPEPLRIYWAWNAAGPWLAADNPRLQFAHHPALFKLYVVRSLTRPDEPLQEDPSQDFLRQFLPEVHKALFTSD